MRAGRNACTFRWSRTPALGLLLASIVSIVPVASVSSASSFTGTLFIIVEDAGSRRIAGASITVSSPSGLRFSGLTDANGTRGFGVPAGEYDVLISKQGFRDFTVHKEVADNRNVTVTAQMATDRGSGIYVFAGVLAAVVAIGVVGTLLKRRKRARALREEKEASEGEKGSRKAGGAGSKKESGKKPEPTGVEKPKIDVVAEPPGK
ncbi:MAG TPA: carboxypeptidase-like regulatory domain-containing protein [Thermoplasmata archaeon]|nr:carboxypeptidase-like regulatory domain-containing protein [Thermoplasmata archaeon]